MNHQPTILCVSYFTRAAGEGDHVPLGQKQESSGADGASLPCLQNNVDGMHLDPSCLFDDVSEETQGTRGL